jgi:hypothetical protein
VRHPLVVLLVTSLAALPALAQSDYRNVDGGRPVRIEDATATPRHALEAQIGAIRAERFAGGMLRLQLEPRLNFGVLPRTELKLRAPLAHRTDGPRPRSGLLGIAVGGFHSFNNESPTLPAFAVEGEMLLSARAAATGGATYAVRGIATRSFSRSRVHLNAGYGTYRVRPPEPGTNAGPVVPDAPCGISPSAHALHTISPPVSQSCSAAPHEAEIPTAQTGTRFLGGMAIDRTFPLRSLLVIGNVLVESYRGALRSTDWTVELGTRRQITPRSAFEASIGHRFTGMGRAWIASFGITTSIAARMFIPEAR